MAVLIFYSSQMEINKDTDATIVGKPYHESTTSKKRGSIIVIYCCNRKKDMLFLKGKNKL